MRKSRFIRLFVPFSFVFITPTKAATLTNVNDWGSGFIATYSHTITTEDTSSGSLRNWQFDIDHSGNANILNAWMSEYSGSIDAGYDGDIYQISNQQAGFSPTLDVGSTITFNLQGQGEGFNESNFDIVFSSLDIEGGGTIATSPVEVNDWGSGFIATFECTITSHVPVDQFLVDFNYSGSGTPSSAWANSYNGSIETGPIGTDGGFAIRSTTSGPILNSGDSFSVSIMVSGTGYQESDFNTVCRDPSELVDETVDETTDQPVDEGPSGPVEVSSGLIISSLNPTSFNVLGGETVFTLTGADFDPDFPIILLNNYEDIPSGQVSINQNEVVVSGLLVSGLNEISIDATDTAGNHMVFQQSVWAGGSTVKIDVIDETGQPVAATIAARISDDSSIGIDQSTGTDGTLTLSNLPFRTVIVVAQTDDGLIGSVAFIPTMTNSETIVVSGVGIPSDIDNNDFSQGTSGWSVAGSGSVQIIQDAQ